MILISSKKSRDFWANDIDFAFFSSKIFLEFVVNYLLLIIYVNLLKTRVFASLSPFLDENASFTPRKSEFLGQIDLIH